MRARLTLLFTTLAACSLEPVDIAHVAPADEDALGDPSAGTAAAGWLEGDLLEGVVELVELGGLTKFYESSRETASGESLRAIELEIVAVDPPQLAADLVVVLRDRDYVRLGGFSVTSERMHFEGTLELGWSLELGAASPQQVELHAAFVESP